MPPHILTQGLYPLARATMAQEQPPYLVVAVDPVNFEKPYTRKLPGVSIVYKRTPPPLRGKKRLTRGYPAITPTVVNTRVPATTYAHWFSYRVGFRSENWEIQMVVQSSTVLDGVFHALADPTRRAMLRSLAAGQRTIGELAAPFSMSLTAASKHVRVLERAGLVRRRVEGRSHGCRLEAAPLAAADEWLRLYQAFWTDQLDALDALLKAEDAAATQSREKGDA